MDNFNKNVSIPVRYEVQSFDDDRIKKVKIYVMHDKLNLNGSNFEMDAIESAKESIKNIPILAFVKKNDGTDGDDFAGHEMELVITSDGDVKYRYLGRPIGVIPEMNNDYHYEIYDDKTYVVVNGYIWADYANEALDILMRDGEKSQSMEIRIDDADWNYDNDWYDIKKYRYTGVTILGDDVLPAMVGAKVQLSEYQFSAEYFSMVEELSEKLKEHFTEEGGNNEMLNNENQNQNENFEDNQNENLENEESNENLNGEFENNDNESEENENENSGEFNSDNQENNTDENNDNHTDYESIANQQNETISQLNTELSNLQGEYAQLQSKYQSLEEEVATLRSFKADIESAELMSKKNAIIQEFSIALTEEEIQPVKDKINELTEVELEFQLNKILSAKTLSNLKSQKQYVSDDGTVKIEIPKKDNPKSRYAVE